MSDQGHNGAAEDKEFPPQVSTLDMAWVSVLSVESVSAAATVLQPSRAGFICIKSI